MDTTPHEWMCLASRTETTHTQKKGRIFYFILFLFLGGRVLLNVSVLVTSGLIASKTGCVPEAEEEGCFISTLSFCQRLRGKIDAAGWFTSWNPLLPLKSLKTLSLSGELLLYFPKSRTSFYTCVRGKKREWTLFFPSLLSPSFFFPHDWADLTMWSQRN